VRPGRTRIPDDKALPQIERLLDGDAVAPVLERMLGDDADISSVRVAYVRYRPAKRLLVVYELECGGTAASVVAQANSGGRDLAERATRPASVALVARVSGRTPAATPLAYDTGLEALFQWPPLDLGLPALAETPERLRRELVDAGLELERADDLPRLVKHRHAQRAVLRLDGHIAKVYRNEEALAEAVAALAAAEALPVRTARREAVVPELRITVQSLVPGGPPAGVLQVAGRAGDVLAALHGAAPADGLPAESPRDRLRRTGDSADLLATIAPELAPRVEKLMGRLEAQLPADDLVTSHGGFHISQLLESDGELAVIDFDGICLAPAARDVASYVASLLDAPEDLPSVRAALDALCEGYGRRPTGVAWYLSTLALRRARAPFAAFAPHWPEDTERRLAAAEAALAL
jgi:Ser/Thr protein kinase RdoA (MazF antagonist)